MSGLRVSIHLPARVYTPHEQQVLKRLVTPEPKFNEKDDPTHDWIKAGWLSDPWVTFHADLGLLLREMPDLHVTVLGQDSFEMPGLLARLVEKLENPVEQSRMKFNDHVNVIVPDTGLMRIRSVLVLDDCCTEELQRMLDKGWVLLAVCPQPARRPDYVVGHIQENMP